MQKARSHSDESKLLPLVSAWFQVLLTPLSVYQEYLVLPDGAGKFRQGVSDPALLRIPLSYIIIRLRDCHPLWYHFPETSASMMYSCMVLQPLGTKVPRFGLFRFRSPLLTESLLFSLPPVT